MVYKIILAITALFLITACGIKGDLYLPDEAAIEKQ